MTIWTGSSYVFFGVEGPLVEVLSGYRYDFDDDFHLTTHFLGKTPLKLEIAQEALSTVRMAADILGPTELPLTEFATFGPPTAPARVAKFEASHELYRWRAALEKALDFIGGKVSKDWPWSPHMTYSYGFNLEKLQAIEKVLLTKGARSAKLTLTSLCMYDGRAKLVVPL